MRGRGPQAPERRPGDALTLEATQRAGYAVLALSGGLGVAEAPAAREALRKLATDRLDLVVCDLSGLDWLRPSCVAVFTASAPTVAWPAPALWLAGASGQVADALRRCRVGAMIGIADTVALAIERSHDRPVHPRAVEVLAADLHAPKRGRIVAAEAVAAWGLPETTAAVAAVVSELVTNAVLRATEEVELRLERRGNTILVAVRDSAAMFDLSRASRGGVDQLEENGRGLLLVKAIADAVGVARHPGGGKVTWAAVPVRQDQRGP